MDAVHLLEEYYPDGTLASTMIKEHSLAVAVKAVAVATSLSLPRGEIEFIRQGAILHDIGIRLTNAPEIGCFGDLPYLAHGYKGYELLLKEGLPKHALVCERHTGAGITLAEIECNNLPIPLRPMIPVSLAEKIICYCDKFFSKDHGRLAEERPLKEVIAGIGKYGAEKVGIFMQWHREFSQ